MERVAAMGRLRPLLLAPVVLGCTLAHAGRPLSSETADVLEDGANEVEVYAARVTASGSPDLTGWSTQYARGIGWGTQLGIAASRVNGDARSVSVVQLGGKTELIALKEDAPGLSFGYAVNATRESGDSWRHDGSILGLVGTLPVGDALLLHANLGWRRSSILGIDSVTWALASEFSPVEKLTLTAEAYGDNRERPIVAIGASWQLTPVVNLNTSYAVAQDTPRLQEWTLGVRFEF